MNKSLSKILMMLVLCMSPSCSYIIDPIWYPIWKPIWVSKERQKLRDIQKEEKAPLVIDGEVEPRMPDDKENDKTIAGIDINNNGVRDDLEIWINRNFDTAEKRKALKQYAKAYSKWLEMSDGPIVEIQKHHSQELQRSSNCIDKVFTEQKIDYSTQQKAFEEIDFFIIFSSSLRKNAEHKIWDRAIGHDLMSYQGTVESYCDFRN